MRTRSLKETLPKLTGMILLLFLLLILPLNFFLQLYLKHQSQKESTQEMFGQLEQLIQATEEELDSEEEDFKQRCIRAADMVAYHVSRSTEDITDLQYVRELAGIMNVDEIHFFTPEGEIFAGTHPQYYGYTFDSGEQMHFFSPMLQDKTMKLCQDITPNTAEEKEMQYAAVWLEDGSCIVQIGMEPWRLRKKLREKSLENMVDGMPFEMNGYLHVFDTETNTIVASTSKNLMGMVLSSRKWLLSDGSRIRMFHEQFRGDWYCVYTKPYQKYIMVRTYRSFYLLNDTMKSTGFVIVYVFLGGFGIIALIRWYVQKKLIKSLDGIIEELQKIETGNLDNINIKTGITEFEKLLFYMNQMLDSVRFSHSQLKYILDQEEIPFGFFEKNCFYNRFYANKRLMEILGFEGTVSKERYAQVENELIQVENNPANEAERVYQYCRNGEERYLHMKKVEDAQEVIYYVTDVTHLWNNVSQVKRQSQKDELTGLLNRRGLYETMNRLFETPDVLGKAAILMIDGDNLKQINDRYGHFMGDRYLKQIADAVGSASGEKAVCARLGGDEFVSFLYGCSEREELERKIERIRQERGKPFEIARETLQFSLGAAFYPEDGGDFHDLMQIADERMYREKKIRKNQD